MKHFRNEKCTKTAGPYLKVAAGKIFDEDFSSKLIRFGIALEEREDRDIVKRNII